MPTRKRRSREKIPEYESSRDDSSVEVTATPDQSFNSLTVLTPQTRNLLSLCRDIDADLAKWKASDAEVGELKALVERHMGEKLKMISRLEKAELEGVDKDATIRKLQNRLSALEEHKAETDPESRSLRSLKKSLLRMREENRLYKNINSNVSILREQIKSYEQIIEAQKKELSVYREWNDTNRSGVFGIEALKLQLATSEKEKANATKELDFSKNKYQAVETQAQNAEERVQTLENEVQSLKNEIANQRRQLAETQARCSRAIESRDAFRALLDSCEVGSSLEQGLKERCQKMESLILGLEQQCEKLEVANKLLTLHEPNPQEVSVYLNRFSAHIPFRAKNAITGQMEVSNDRILHLGGNPHEIYEKTVTQRLEEVLKENETFNKAIKQLSRNVSNTLSFEQQRNLGRVFDLIKDLPTAADFTKIKEEAINHKKLAARFRQASGDKIKALRGDYIKLLGYGLEYSTDDNTIRLTSVYSRNPEQHLVFAKCPGGKSFKLVQNEFLASVEALASKYHDIPALTAAITLELFKLSQSI